MREVETTQREQGRRPLCGTDFRSMGTATLPDTERRLIEFASDVTRLADERRDIELRELVNELHADLMAARDDDDAD
jgi:hypothetical protein